MLTLVRRSAVSALSLFALTACSQTYDTHGDGGPDPVKPVESQRTEAPSESEIEGMVDDTLRDIEASIDANPALIHCVDVTSIDYNWQNDFRCTRPNGRVFYTDEAGARAVDGSDPKAGCRIDSPGADARWARMLRKWGLCD